MNQDMAKGKVKEEVGKAIGAKSTELGGKAEQNIQNATK
jgi:uncharacterized protein YjbJ (UPF0337 family)